MQRMFQRKSSRETGILHGGHELMDYKRWLQVHDDNERIDSDLTDVLGTELEEECYRESLHLGDFNQ